MGGTPTLILRTEAVVVGIISPAISESSVTMNAPTQDKTTPIRFSQSQRLPWVTKIIEARIAVKIASRDPEISLRGPKKIMEGISWK